ncbi:MAG: DSD1 family PLP-dependent enzyme [Burkholderiaceae bacterium]
MPDSPAGFARPAAPAVVGDPISGIDTPALIIDLEVFESNLALMREQAARAGVRLRAHAKTHKSVDIARLQIERGGACGICCQKVSEAEVMVAGGIRDVLVSNQVVGPARVRRLARLAHQARILVCVDDPANVDDLAAAARAEGVRLECLVEIDVGMHRCGVMPGAPALALARRVLAHDCLRLAGLQAYHGRAQHIYEFEARQSAIGNAIALTRETVALFAEHGIDCEIVGGAGTGSYPMEAASGVYNELQCGSYVFMDADYRRVLDAENRPGGLFASSLFVLASVVSTAVAGQATCDAGLKALAVDSGPPRVHGRDELDVLGVADEHTILADRGRTLQVLDRLWLVPGHCDPTCNLYDWYVGVRGGRVEAVWPVSARGCLV